MKKLFLAAIVAVFLTASAFTATKTTINYKIESSFKNEFEKATDIRWSKVGDYVKALFVFYNQTMEAFYNDEGSLIGTSHAITLEELPTSAKRTFAKKYKDYTVKEVILFEGSDEQAYFISAQKEEEKVILKVVGGQVLVFRP